MHSSLERNEHQYPIHTRIISFHSCQILSPSETGFIVPAHRLPNITLLTLIATLQLQGESPTCILNEDTQPVIRAIGVSHTACKLKTSFDKIFDLTAGVYFYVFNIPPHHQIIGCFFFIRKTIAKY